MNNYLDFKTNIDYIKLKEPAKIIKNGGIVVFPTETVYGIGVNGLNEKALKKLYEVKQRPLNKPISLLVNSIEMINQLTKNITKLEYALMKEFFPGPLTIILQKKDIVPDILTANSDTVGIRMPSNKVTLKLIEYAGVPIATPSANLSGKPTGTNFKDVIKDFYGKADYFIDGKISKTGTASTIVKVTNGIPHILRQGPITEEQIKNVYNKCYNITI